MDNKLIICILIAATYIFVKNRGNSTGNSTDNSTDNSTKKNTSTNIALTPTAQAMQAANEILKTTSDTAQRAVDQSRKNIYKNREQAQMAVVQNRLTSGLYSPSVYDWGL